MSVSRIRDAGDYIYKSPPGPVSGAACRSQAGKSTPSASKFGLLLVTDVGRHEVVPGSTSQARQICIFPILLSHFFLSNRGRGGTG